MSTNSFLSPRLLMGAAIVGIVGAAGMFIYEQMYAEKRRAMLVREVARLDKQVSSMRTELEALRELQKETNLRRQKQQRRRVKRAENSTKNVASGDATDGPDKSYASDSEYFTDYQSVLSATDADMDSEEFYDVHTDDDDDNTLQGTARNGLGDGTDVDEELSDKADVLSSTNKVST